MRISPARALLLVLVPAAAFAAACDGDDDTAPGAYDAVDSGPPRTPVNDAAPADDGGVRATAEILHVVETVNTGEITQGNLAQTRATSADVMAFAAMMVSEHTAANLRVATLAQQKGVTPQDNAVSQALKQSADASTAQLQSLSGRAFDVAYIDAQVIMHKMTLDTIDGQLLPNATDAAVTAELTTTRASVLMHYNHAQRIQQSLAGDAGADAGDAGDAAATAR